MTSLSFHDRHLALMREIENRFDVARWRAGDIDLWPMARMGLFLDAFERGGGGTAGPAPAFAQRAMAGLAAPLTNAWKSRHDLVHYVARPRPAYALMLGDGVSLDRIEGAWQDRFCEPVIAALERGGRGSLLMQPGNLTRLPWRRPTLAANTVSIRGALGGALGRGKPMDLPDHEAVLRLLEHHGAAHVLDAARLARRARTVDAAASAFQRILRKVRPSLAFVVTYYAGLGHAFALACRREGVLSVDLQHCPQDGRHRAYCWQALPDRGYTTLPAVFWTWQAEDADHIRRWAETAAAPWHRSLHGGHTQLAAFLDDEEPATRAWDKAFRAIGGCHDREILVALQPIGGQRARWQALAEVIERAPANWRWWIRRHPASTPAQDAGYARLLDLRRPNVVIEEAARLPLPALMRHMNALVSLASGAAGEAAAFGVPALFLDPDAAGPFAGLIERQQAAIVDIAKLVDAIARAPMPVRPRHMAAPLLEETLLRLDAMADDYARLCERSGTTG